MTTSAASNSVTIVTKHDPFTPADTPVVLLLECAPDAGLPFNKNSTVNMTESLGHPEMAKLRAWRLTQKLIAGESAFEGVLQLHVMEEIIIRALENIFHAIHLDAWLRNAGVRECRFRGPSPYIERLRAIQAVTGSEYSICAPAAESLSISQKVKRRVQTKGFSGIGDSLVLGARRLFPNLARYVASIPKARRSKIRGGWWFYSTAYTFTNIGLAYEPHLTRQFNYLVDSSETSDKPLLERGRSFYDIYAWASPGDLPAKSALKELRDRLLALINEIALEGDEHIACTALLQSAAFNTYLNRILPLTCFHSRLSAKFLEEVAPEIVVVGNAAFEGPLLQLARARGIPTVLLQHGILGDYYQLMEQPAGSLLVRGEFWKEFVAKPMQARTHVLNFPGGTKATFKESSKNGKVLFLTSVDAALAHTHESDLREILSRLLRVCAGERRVLVVRVHPMETIGYYQNAVESVSSDLKLKAAVEYSQGGGLEQVLADTSVAVTYSSTVFLDCLRLGIPIVSFNWHDFAYKSLIEQHKIFHFAESLADLERLVRDGIAGLLASNRNYERFLASTPRMELQAFFNSLPAKG